MDDLLCDNLAHARPQLERDIQEALANCDEDELRLVKEVSRSVLEAVRRNWRFQGE